jgi:hypothetical protein
MTDLFNIIKLKLVEVMEQLTDMLQVQHELVGRIETDVEMATETIKNGSTEMTKAVVASRISRKKKWILAGIVLFLLIILGFVIYFYLVMPAMQASNISSGDKKKKVKESEPVLQPDVAPAVPAAADPVEEVPQPVVDEVEREAPVVDQPVPPPSPSAENQSLQDDTTNEAEQEPPAQSAVLAPQHDPPAEDIPAPARSVVEITTQEVEIPTVVEPGQTNDTTT